MATLHTVNKSPLSSTALADCLRAASQGDGLLLIEDGVYAVTSTDALQQIQQHGIELWTLIPDLQARGLLPRLPETVEAVDDAGFVALCCRHDKVCSWY